MASVDRAQAAEDRLPWTGQWHIAVDGTVIHQRSKGDQPHQQLFRRYATTRPVTLDDIAKLRTDLEERDHRIDRETRPWVVTSWTFIAVAFIGFALLFLGIVGVVEVGIEVGALLIGVALLAACVLPVLLRISLRGGPDDSPDGCWAEAGFVPAEGGITMAASEARSMIQAPGATSGPVVPSAHEPWI